MAAGKAATGPGSALGAFYVSRQMPEISAPFASCVANKGHLANNVLEKSAKEIPYIGDWFKLGGNKKFHVRGWENLLAGLKNWILPKTHLSTNKLIFRCASIS